MADQDSECSFIRDINTRIQVGANISFSVRSMTNKFDNLDPIDTRRKLNVHKKFRRRPGRLLNVLCTFNLRPVSRGGVGSEGVDFLGTYITQH